MSLQITNITVDESVNATAVLLSSKIVDFTLNEGITNTIIPTNSNYFANFGYYTHEDLKRRFLK